LENKRDRPLAEGGGLSFRVVACDNGIPVGESDLKRCNLRPRDGCIVLDAGLGLQFLNLGNVEFEDLCVAVQLGLCSIQREEHGGGFFEEEVAIILGRALVPETIVGFEQVDNFGVPFSPPFELSFQ
jgi:hypothetical protein